ncbi:hypothetical protein AJ79_09609 [Helicocarpus griseus UAMH5409]|uniref:Uncharacterized protein n=1 Tax=Helicocarpus griseus UAMH5409 TaxID=1447875 RepID=A0A2B7WIG3_9EURO|nr:hypothetical protein AJ79_09609 [Helicocarpus griseus UAMH5409]
MADFTASRPLQNSSLWALFQVSECLENHRIKHCIVGDAIIALLGYPLVVSDLYLAVADEQLEDAHTVVRQQNFKDACGHACFVDKDATDSPAGWPGYRLVKDSEKPENTGVVLVPSGFWHLDLSVPSLLANTFLHPTTSCRFPKRLFYIQGLIDVVIERFLSSGVNVPMYGYFELQYTYMLGLLSHDILLRLPPEDQFFIDLFHKVLTPSARKKVCLQRQQIRNGLISVDGARQLIPRKDLALAAIQRRYHKDSSA